MKREQKLIPDNGQITIVFGPAASGKTLNRINIARLFGCDYVTDWERQWDIKNRVDIEKRVLVLSQLPNPQELRGFRGIFKDAHVVDIRLVKQLLGDQWIEPAYRVERTMES